MKKQDTYLSVNSLLGRQDQKLTIVNLHSKIYVLK